MSEVTKQVVLDALNQVGGTLRTRLKAIFADPEGLVSACRQFLDRTRNEVSLQQAALNKAMGEEQIADLAAAAEALERLRLLLRTLTEEEKEARSQSGSRQGA